VAQGHLLLRARQEGPAQVRHQAGPHGRRARRAPRERVPHEAAGTLQRQPHPARRRRRRAPPALPRHVQAHRSATGDEVRSPTPSDFGANH
jgi:hypothetical protein